MNTVIKITKEFKTRENFKEISQGETNYFIGDMPLNAYYSRTAKSFWQIQKKT
jgi:hypothetical protein